MVLEKSFLKSGLECIGPCYASAFGKLTGDLLKRIPYRKNINQEIHFLELFIANIEMPWEKQCHFKSSTHTPPA